MTTSSSYNFTRTRNDIIFSALRKLGKVAAGIPPSTQDVNALADMLNCIMKQWIEEDIPIWTLTQGILFLETAKTKYTLAGTAKVTDDWVETTLNTAASSGATTIVVTSSTGMTVGDNIGLLINSTTQFWTTITNISSTTITLNTALTSSAASGISVYTYTSALTYQPIDILKVRRKDDQGNEIEITRNTYEEYFRLPQKDMAGDPILWMYTPEVSDGNFYFYMAPNDITKTIRFTFKRPIQDVDNPTDTLDVTPACYTALIYTLADMAAPDYGKEDKAAKDIGPKARYYYETLKSLTRKRNKYQFIVKHN